MSVRIERLEKWGCNVKEAMDLMLNDDEFYLTNLEKLVEEPSFSLLTKALQDKNTTEAFDRAHALKGVLSNLSIIPMYNVIVEIMESLKSESFEGLIEKNEELLRLKDELKEILN